MEEKYLYKQIADSIREQIIQGTLKAGDRLPSVREMTKNWNCTPGTVQRAYKELAKQNLVVSRAGQGTRITDNPHVEKISPLQRASLIHKAEAFLLEGLSLGFTPEDVDSAFHLALDRWRVIEAPPALRTGNQIKFVGSHDLVVNWLAAHFKEISPDYALELRFTGSLGGLIALAENKADLAGSHLWDSEHNTYNRSYVHRLLPGKRTALVTLAQRKLGFILLPGNPQHIKTLQDLTRPEVRFVNRQSGSGTRVWLDTMLGKSGIDPAHINGFDSEVSTHSEVARTVSQGSADVGIGLEASAASFELDFIHLAHERYDLVIPEESMTLKPIQDLIAWLSTPDCERAIHSLGGYDTGKTGRIEWVE